MHYSLIQELQDAISNESTGRRIVALRKITDLFLEHGNRLTPEQVNIFDNLLLGFIRDVEAEDLAELAQQLATVPFAPSAVIRRLAIHCDRAVATPVLTVSERLSNEDLLEVATTRGQGHLLAIAGRFALDTVLTDAIIELGDREVRRRVAGNPGASFTRGGLVRLVAASKGDPLLAEKVGLRGDLPNKLLRELLDNATSAVHIRLVNKAPTQLRAEIQKHVDDISRQIKRDAERPRDLRSAVDLVKRLVERRELTENRLADFATDRQYEAIIATLAAMTSSPIALIEPLMRVHRHDGLITACRAADLSWETTQAVILSRLMSSSDVDVGQLRRKYEEMSFSSAKRALLIWREQVFRPRKAG
ncbi:DUF2336 domain-containing protein [Bradyrhizobium sp. SYSU BS000235]|uniref:DUF2336 domain-containing protein n=1 Tax=Bradyrhizobium sp. SYSU BS000235 TaxID=3411332 RepID=UPI003C73A67F